MAEPPWVLLLVVLCLCIHATATTPAHRTRYIEVIRPVMAPTPAAVREEEEEIQVGKEFFSLIDNYRFTKIETISNQRIY